MPATERSYYPALRDLFDAIGRTLKPSVSAATELAGEHHPDLGLFEAKPRRAGSAVAGDAAEPDRGVVEVKLPDAEIEAVAGSEQVRRYQERYGRVLVTNLREFLLVAPGADGAPAFGERFRLAGDPAEFDELLAHPRRAAGRLAGELGILGVPTFVFQEGDEPIAARAFRQIARLTGGAHCRFDSSSADQLRDLLSAVAVFAAGGRKALESFGERTGGEALLIARQVK